MDRMSLSARYRISESICDLFIFGAAAMPTSSPIPLLLDFLATSISFRFPSVKNLRPRFQKSEAGFRVGEILEQRRVVIILRFRRLLLILVDLGGVIVPRISGHLVNRITASRMNDQPGL